MMDEKLDAAFDERLKPINDQLNDLRAGQTHLKAGQVRLKEDVSFVRGRVAAIEIEHGKKPDALFDGQMLLREKLNPSFDNTSAKGGIFMTISHRGAIQFGLDHIPVTLCTATQEHDIAFNQPHKGASRSGMAAALL